MTERVKPKASSLMIWSFVVTGIASLAGLGILVARAVEKVFSGHGLETYRTVWLVEFNYMSLLVLFGAVLVVLLIGGGYQLREYFQLRALEKKYGIRDDDT